MRKIDLTISSCVSDIECYQKCVLSSIKHLRKRFNISILPIFNYDNIYTSSIAGNIALECSKTRYTIYLHQDVSFNECSGDKLFDCLTNKNDNCAIIGSAGVNLSSTIDEIGEWGNKSRNIELGCVKDSSDNIVWGDHNRNGIVHTLDEMMLIFDKNINIRFDPTLTGYHLYALDICLQSRSAGYDVMSIDIGCKHHGEYSSSIYRDKGFMRKLIHLHRKWNYKFNFLSAPYCHWYNNSIVSYIPFSLINDNDKIDVVRFKVELKNTNAKHSLLTSSS